MAKSSKPKGGKRSAPLNPDDWLDGPAEDDSASSMPPRDDEDDGEPASGTAGMLVNKSKLGLILGYSQSYIDKALANGAPFVSKGTRKEGWRINTAAFHAWAKQQAVDAVRPEGAPDDFEAAKTRAMAAQADQREMDNKRKRGETLTIDEAVMLYREEASSVRAQLMAIPGRLAIPLAAESDAVAVEAMISDEVNLALSNITGDTVEAWKSDDHGTDSESD